MVSCSGISTAPTDKYYGSASGCKGGLPEDAFQFVVDNGGIATSQAYPYASSNQSTDVAAVRFV